MNQHIEGLPPGTKIKSVQLSGKPGERGFSGSYVVLETDNVYGFMDLDAVPIPEGYERAGDTPEKWFRTPLGTCEEWFLSNGGSVGSSRHYYGGDCPEDTRRIILRKVKRTKRVLVLEFPITDGLPCDIEFAKFACGGASMALNSANATVRRIEEREVAPPLDPAPICDRCGVVYVKTGESMRGIQWNHACTGDRPRAEAGPPRAAEPTLHEFRMFCEKHPELRFWQALAAWSGAKAIEFVPHSNGECPRVPNRDTFQWKGRKG